jgi:hypothetical protein
MARQARHSQGTWQFHWPFHSLGVVLIGCDLGFVL